MSRLSTFLLGLTIFALPFHTAWIYQELVIHGAKWQFATLQYFLFELFLWCTVFSVIATKLLLLKKKKIDYSCSTDRVFVLLLLVTIGYGYLSILWADNGSLALQQALRLFEAVLLFLLALIIRLKKEILCLLVAAMILIQAVIAVPQFIHQYVPASTAIGMAEHIAEEPGASVLVGDNIGRVLRAYGTFPHPNILGGFFVVMMMILALIFQKEYKGLLIMTTVLGTLGLYVSFSRSAWVAMALALVLLWFVVPQVRKLYIGTVVISAVVCSLLFFQHTQTRLFGSSSHQVRSVTERVDLVKQASDIIAESPIAGVGIGNYTVAVQQSTLEAPGYELQPVHNVLLLILAELGGVGLTFIVLTWLYYLRFVKMMFGNSARKQAMVFSIVVISLGFFDHYLWTQPSMMLVVAVLLATPVYART